MMHSISISFHVAVVEKSDCCSHMWDDLGDRTSRESIETVFHIIGSAQLHAKPYDFREEKYKRLKSDWTDRLMLFFFI